MTGGKIFFSGVIFSRLKKKKTKKGGKVVSFDLLIYGKTNYSVISVVTTGKLANETEKKHLFVETAPFVNVEGRLKIGVRKHGGARRAVVFLIADKVNFVVEPSLIPYKVV